MEEKEIRSGINFLRWYLQLNPNDLDSQEKLGLMLAERSYVNDLMKDSRMAQEAFERLDSLLRISPEKKAARMQVIKIAMLPRFHRPQDAEQHLDYLLNESPQDPQLLELLGECYVENHKYDLAKQALKKSIAISSSQIGAYQKLANLLRKQHLEPEADQWMDKLVKVNPKSAQAHFLRGRYLTSIPGRGDEAFLEAMKAQSLDPDDSEILRLAATCHAQKGEFDKARECLTHGIKLHPENIILYTTLCTVEKQSRDSDKALDVLQQGLKATGRNMYLLWSMADLMIDIGKLKESQEILKELQTSGYRRDLIEYSKARIQFVQSHWLEAKNSFERVRGLLITLPELVVQVDVNLATCYEKLGNRDLQMEALHRALSTNPTYAPALIAQMNALLAVGRIDDVLRIQNELSQRGNIGPGNAIVLTRLLMYKALRQPAAQRDWSAVEGALAAAEKATPNSQDITMLREVLSYQDRTSEAETLLSDACTKNPKEANYWMSLVTLATQQKNWEKTENLLAKSEKALGDGLPLRLMRIQYVQHRSARIRKPPALEENR